MKTAAARTTVRHDVVAYAGVAAAAVAVVVAAVLVWLLRTPVFQRQCEKLRT